MKFKILTPLLGLMIQTSMCATLTIQNSSNDVMRVWLYDDKDSLIDTWLVTNDNPKTVNSHLRAITTVAWAAEKSVPHDANETAGQLSSTLAGGIPYTFNVHMKPLSVGHKLFILKDGNFKYQPGITKKDETIVGRAHKLSDSTDQ